MQRLSYLIGFIAFSALFLGAIHSCDGVTGTDTQLAVVDNMSVPELVAALKNPKYNRSIICIELGGRNEKSAILPLREALTDTSLSVRVDAARALLMLGDTTGVQALKDALKCNSPKEATIAAATLARYGGDYTGVEVARLHLTDKSPGIRIYSLIAVGLCPKDDIAYPALQAGLGDKSESVRSQAIWLLSKRKSPRSVDLLSPLMSSPDSLCRLIVLQAIADTQVGAAIPVLIEVLSNTDEAMRCYAAGQLNRLTGRKQPDLSLDKAEKAQEANKEWRAWWSANKKDYPPEKKLKVPEPPPNVIPAIL